MSKKALSHSQIYGIQVTDRLIESLFHENTELYGSIKNRSVDEDIGMEQIAINTTISGILARLRLAFGREESGHEY